MKYIIVKDQFEEEVPILFPESLQHRDVVNMNSTLPVVSAGFCNIGIDGLWYAQGESISLKKRSRQKDATIIGRYVRGN